MTTDAHLDGDFDEHELRRRLAAAETTVAVLKRQVKRLYDEGTQTGLSRQLARAQERQRAVEQRRLLTEVREEELRRYSRTLEAEVRLRTADLRAIHDHLTSGFLLVDAEGVVQPGYTRSCHDLMGSGDIQGAALVDLLRLDDERDRSALQLGLEKVFDDLLPEEATIGQLPSRFEIDNRVLGLDFSCVRDDNRSITTMLVTITDVTALEATTRENRRNQMLVGLSMQREAFSAFVADSRAQLTAAKEAIDDEVFVRRAVHTVKGNAGAFGLDDLAMVAHGLEDGDITVDGIDRLATELADFLTAHSDVIGLDYHSEVTSVVEVPRSLALHLQELVGDCAANSGRLQQLAAELMLRPAAAVLGPIASFGTGLAERQGKRVRVEVTGGEVLVDAEHVRPVFAALIHVIRNAVDHGVERPEDRTGKSAEATVQVIIADHGSSWRIVIADDGRGIDVDALGRRAVADGHITDTELAALTEPQRLQLVFADGLSTTTRVDEVSGRGEGMSALGGAVSALGGAIDVTSLVGQGTTLDIRLPKPPQLLLRQATAEAVGVGPT